VLGITPAERFGDRHPRAPALFELWNFGVPIGIIERPEQRYLVHPAFRDLQCDVAALDVSDIVPSENALPAVANGSVIEGCFTLDKRMSGLRLIPSINDLPARGELHTTVEDMFLPIGQDVTLFGFPGARDFQFSPIGVNTKIASSQFDESPFMLVSGPVFRGCSGGPAIARAFGGYHIVTRRAGSYDYNITDLHPGYAVIDQFLGIYAGRYESRDGDFADEGDKGVQIGVVWKSSLLEDIAIHGIPDIDC
jgi:hypothetical protein